MELSIVGHLAIEYLSLLGSEVGPQDLHIVRPQAQEVDVPLSFNVTGRENTVEPLLLEASEIRTPL